ncbi:diaminopimelate epimerase [Kamptonema cortianum]|nr:diaminopimelate epimerase [Geitlerinema splendidum]MDK3156853.1 diaminopimelate epimerase [Kamptonema cortianum]
MENGRCPFWKLETVGNDFVLVNQQDVQGVDLPRLAIQLCERRFSIGSDGLLVLDNSSDQLKLQFFNPDGTVDFCGNGLRCAAWHAYRQGWVGTSFDIHQDGAVIAMDVRRSGSVTARMPAANYSPTAVPILSEDEWIDRQVAGVTGTAVSTGSTHFVSFVDEFPSELEFNQLGPAIEHDRLFPLRTSIMWTKVIHERHLAILIWERGIGETLGCGTGAIAAASVWFKKAGLSGDITVQSKGGMLKIFMESYSSPVTVTSEPEELFSGTIQIEQ